MTTASIGPSKAFDAKAKPFVKRVERLKDEIATMTGEHMARCKTKREEIKEVYTEAKDAGLLMRPLKAIVKGRELQAKMKELGSDFEDQDQEQWLKLAQGELGPLGISAALKAGYNGKDADDGDDKDVRPDFLQRQEAERKKDGDITKLGRGPTSDDAPKPH